MDKIITDIEDACTDEKIIDIKIYKMISYALTVIFDNISGFNFF
jgi:hypothetical protein